MVLKTIRLTDPDAVNRQAQLILKNAARIYVLAAYGHIRVDTGMSRGTLVPLAHAINFNMPLSPKRTLPGKGVSQGSQQSAFSFKQNGNIHSFEWASNVFQYYLNEQFPLRSNSSSPWYSLMQGSEKAKTYLLNSKSSLARAVKQTWSTQVRSI